MTFERGHPPYPRRSRPVEPAMWSDAQGENQPVLVSRFLSVDVPHRGQWLLDRLCKKWPHISNQNFQGRVLGWIGSNSHFLAKTSHAIGLARVVRTECDLHPIAEEVFLFLDDRKYDRDAYAFYQATGKWAKNLGAVEYIIARCSDCPTSALVRNIGAVEDIIVSLEL